MPAFACLALLACLPDTHLLVADKSYLISPSCKSPGVLGLDTWLSTNRGGKCVRAKKAMQRGAGKLKEKKLMNACGHNNALRRLTLRRLIMLMKKGPLIILFSYVGSEWANNSYLIMPSSISNAALNYFLLLVSFLSLD